MGSVVDVWTGCADVAYAGTDAVVSGFEGGGKGYGGGAGFVVF